MRTTPLHHAARRVASWPLAARAAISDAGNRVPRQHAGGTLCSHRVSSVPATRFSPLAHRGARVVGTDTLRISVVLQVSSDDQECEQGSEDNPNVNAHQSSPTPVGYVRSICYI
jgi:hypothetical protein